MSDLQEDSRQIIAQRKKAHLIKKKRKTKKLQIYRFTRNDIEKRHSGAMNWFNEQQNRFDYLI